ncbi:MAG: sulfotransferase family protein [Chloroflexota bacterium]
MYADDNISATKIRKNPRLVLWWTFHRLTTPFRALPDFLVVGTQKGGTTSLFNYLIQHPQVLSPLRKELKFFDSNYFRGLSWYRAHFPLRSKLRAAQALTGEASPYYMYHPTAPERIHAALPSVKLIAILRNPVDRAYSHYQHMVRVKREDLTFEQALEAESDRLAGEAEKIAADASYPQYRHIQYSYLERGRYAEQLQTLFRLFPKENILILKSEDLYAEPAKVMETSFSFLGLPFHMGQYEVFKQGTYKGGMDSVTRQKLVEYFRSFNQQLYDLLGMKFDWDK